ncbi:hypothetical protein ACFX2J_043717 [Malus domestica]
MSKSSSPENEGTWTPLSKTWWPRPHRWLSTSQIRLRRLRLDLVAYIISATKLKLQIDTTSKLNSSSPKSSPSSSNKNDSSGSSASSPTSSSKLLRLSSHAEACSGFHAATKQQEAREVQPLLQLR